MKWKNSPGNERPQWRVWPVAEDESCGRYVHGRNPREAAKAWAWQYAELAPWVNEHTVWVRQVDRVPRVKVRLTRRMAYHAELVEEE